MDSRRRSTRLLALVASACAAWTSGCAPAPPAPGPVWLITLERGERSEAGFQGALEPAPGAARFPWGHAVSPVLADQWLSLWTGYWPRTLEGADLDRVPSLFRDLRREGLELRAWLPPAPPDARQLLGELGLVGDRERTAAQDPDFEVLRAHWSEARTLWREWCAAGTQGLLWVHLDAREAGLLPELLANVPEEAQDIGRVFVVEMAGPPEPTAASAAAPWARLADLEESRLVTRAWGWGPGLADSPRSWSSHDLAPTLAEALGLPEPFTEDQAASLLAPDPGFRVLVAERRGAAHRRQVAWLGDLKLWRAAQPLERGSDAPGWSGDHPRLFDWVQDPGEYDDLGPGNAGRVLQLERVFRLWEDQRRVRRRAGQRLGWLVPTAVPEEGSSGSSGAALVGPERPR